MLCAGDSGAKKETAPDAGATTRRLSVTNHNAPSSLPTVFGDEFKGAGQKAGLEIWRIEKLKCIKKLNQADPKDEPPNAGQLAHNGKVCSGDSYIFLHTKVSYTVQLSVHVTPGCFQLPASCLAERHRRLVPPAGNSGCTELAVNP